MRPSKRLHALPLGDTRGKSLKAVREASGGLWRERASCRGMDTNVFFPYEGRPSTVERHEVVTICNECPVRYECLEEALTDRTSNGRLVMGIRGGYGHMEREVMMGTRGDERIARRLHRRLSQDEAWVTSLVIEKRNVVHPDDVA